MKAKEIKDYYMQDAFFLGAFFFFSPLFGSCYLMRQCSILWKEISLCSLMNLDFYSGFRILFMCIH